MSTAPVAQDWVRPRPALQRRLDGALAHRLTTLVAATGYGKSTLLSEWVAAVGAAMHRIAPEDRDLTRFATAVWSALRRGVQQQQDDLAPSAPSALSTPGANGPLGPEAHTDALARAAALAAALSEWTAGMLQRDLVLVLDGVDTIADSPGPARFLETLVRTAPRRLHLVTSSREPLPFPVARLRQEREVLEFDASDLALTVTEVAAWLHQRLGPAGEALARVLHASCGGWPAAVQAAVADLAHTDQPNWTARAAEAPAASASLERLVRDAFAAQPGPTRRLLRAATILPLLTDPIATLLGAAPDTLAMLTSRGLFLEAGPTGHRLTPTSRLMLARQAPLDRAEAYEVAAVAARWYAEQGLPELALRTAVAADHPELAASLLVEHGSELVELPGAVLSAIDRLPAETRDRPELVRLAGLAAHNQGDWERARALLTRVASGHGETAFDASVAWRLGFIDHLRGDFDNALATYQRGADCGVPAAEAAMCAGMGAGVLFMRGDRAGCAALADRAMEQAARLADDRALAAAHMAQAMLAALDGDPRADDAHLLRAREFADRAGDVVQQLRIRSNRASYLLESGACTEALAELEAARRLADLTGFGVFAAMTQSNRAETLLRLGRLEEAAADAADAVARWEALGSRLGYGLNRLAQIQALRGDTRAAVATYRRVLAHAEPTDLQGRGVALAGLAELVAPDDPEQAARLAEQALASSEPMTEVRVRLAGVRVAIAGARPRDAAALLDAVADLASRRRDRAGEAAVAELRATLESDPAWADRAVTLWSQVDDPIGRARAELLRGRLAGPEQAAHVAAEVRARMREIGCRALDDQIDAALAEAPTADLHIETLGSFRVLRGGTPVPRTAWQSRKARELLKVLVTRMGRPIARDHLVETLWPESTDAATGRKRLNVMVSTLRSVLDPGRTYPPDHFVVSEGGALRLDLAHATVDVVRLLELVATATRLDQAGRLPEALSQWRAAESAYTGDFCEEDPYADWPVALREQARLAYVQAARRVAEADTTAGRYEQAARYLLRLLECEPYDEHGHLALVRVLHIAGQRMNAHRHYQRYAELMRELGVEPTPYPS